MLHSDRCLNIYRSLALCSTHFCHLIINNPRQARANASRSPRQLQCFRTEVTTLRPVRNLCDLEIRVNFGLVKVV